MIYRFNTVGLSSELNFHLSGMHIDFGKSTELELVNYAYEPPYQTLRGVPEITFSEDELDMYIWSPVR